MSDLVSDFFGRSDKVDDDREGDERAEKAEAEVGVFVCPDGPAGADAGGDNGEDHGDIDGDAFAAFGDVVAEERFVVHHEEEGDVGDGEEDHAEDTGGDGEPEFGFCAPTHNKETDGTCDAGEDTPDTVGVAADGGIEHFTRGEAVDEHEDDNGGDGHTEDADTEDVAGGAFAGEILE